MMNIIAELQLLFKRRFNVKNNTKYYRLLFGHFLSRTGDAAHLMVVALTEAGFEAWYKPIIYKTENMKYDKEGLPIL